MAKAGRQSGAKDWLDNDKLIMIEGWARDGLTDKQIANEKIGIAENTFCAWKRDYPAILEALKKGKAPVDYKVENKMLEMCLGFYVTVKKPIKVKTEKQIPGKGKLVEEHIEYAEEEVYIPPNVTSQIFWLKNRRPDKWRDKQIIENQGDGMLADLIEGLKDQNENEGQEE